MRNINILLIIGYIFLFIRNRSMVDCCESDEYEGAMCTNKKAIRRIAPFMEAQFYDEATGILNKLRTISLFNFRDHFYKLVGDRLKRLCKCVYKKMTEEYKYTFQEDDVAFKAFGYKLTVKKMDPDTKETLTFDVKNTLIDCYINKKPFTLVEGYTARVCRNCYDVFVIVYDSLNQPGAKEVRVNRNYIKGNPPFQFIGRVNRVDFNTI